MPLLLLLAGCGDESRVPVVPISGQIQVNGEPAEGAQVFLHAQGHSLPENLGPFGTADANGKFTIGSYTKDDGAPAGEYVATVQWLKVVETAGGVGRGPNVLPKEYAKPETSPVKVTVEGASVTLPIEISIK